MPSYSDDLKYLRSLEYNLRRRLNRMEKRGEITPFEYEPFKLDKTKSEEQIHREIQSKLFELGEFGYNDEIKKTYATYTKDYTERIREFERQEQIKHEQIQEIRYKMMELNPDIVRRMRGKQFKYADIDKAIESRVNSGMSKEEIMQDIDNIIEDARENKKSRVRNFNYDINGKWKVPY